MIFSGNQQLLRTLNRLAVLRAIRRYPGISRVQLSDQLGLTRPTIGNLVDDLIEARWLREVRQGPTGALGRRPVALQLDTESRSIIGTDVSCERVICIATTLDGEIREMGIFPPLPSGQQDMVRQLAENIGILWQRMDRQRSEVSALGISLPEKVLERPSHSRTASSAHPPDQVAETLRSTLREELLHRNIGNVPIFIEDSVICRATYHFEFCLTEEHSPLLYLHAGHSIDAAIFLDRSLLVGKRGKMGNIGHYILDPSGPACSCGQSGCANAMTTLAAIQEKSGCNAENLGTAISAGAPQAIGALRWAGLNFGTLAYNLCVQFDPGRIFVDGPVFQYGNHYLHAARESFDRLIHWEGQATPALETVQHEINSAALGAATAALHVLMDPV